MKDYIDSIVSRVEPEILSSLDEICKACPSAYDVRLRGYSHQIKISSLDEIERINLMYRTRDLYNADGDSYQVDHVIPLFKGGLHTVDNLQLITVDEHKDKSREDRRGFDMKESTRQK
jgi:5-methylcytosine-specific restriction endonuclease McrA